MIFVGIAFEARAQTGVVVVVVLKCHRRKRNAPWGCASLQPPEQTQRWAAWHSQLTRGCFA